MRSLKQSTKELIRARKEISLNINGEKTKCIVLSRQQHTAKKLKKKKSFFRKGRKILIPWSVGELKHK